MKMLRRKIELVDVWRATDEGKARSDARVSAAIKFLDDSDLDGRRRVKECRSCYYFQRPRIGGAACSSRQCSFCDTEIHSGSTSVNLICDPCSDKHRLCVHCGGDINMKGRRSLE